MWIVGNIQGVVESLWFFRYHFIICSAYPVLLFLALATTCPHFSEGAAMASGAGKQYAAVVHPPAGTLRILFRPYATGGIYTRKSRFFR